MTMSEGDLAVTQLKFVRQTTLDQQPPPMSLHGPIGWLRTNLLSSPFNIVLTILIALFLAWIIPGLLNFLLIDAVWTGADRDACREVVQHRTIGACWPFVWERLAYFTYGSYPLDERWRVNIFFAMLAVGIFWILWLQAPRRAPTLPPPAPPSTASWTWRNTRGRTGRRCRAGTASPSTRGGGSWRQWRATPTPGACTTAARSGCARRS